MASNNRTSSESRYSSFCSLIPVAQGDVIQLVRGVGYNPFNEGVSDFFIRYDCGGPDLPVGLGVRVAVDREVSRSRKRGFSVILTVCPEGFRMSLKKK